MSPLIVTLATALAAPTFTAEDPEDAALAEEAWALAEVCAGWTPAAAEEIPILRDIPEGDAFAGYARIDDEVGLDRVRLKADAPGATLAHEVAHAWFNGRLPRALSEGMAELLAECVMERAPGHFRYTYSGASALDAMVDLRSWGHDDAGASTETLQQNYTGALRLMRAAAEALPRERLYSRDLDGWEALERALAAAPEPGEAEAITAVIHGGGEAQRDALEDLDLDDVGDLREALIGTDPTRWDTDGDGWWDDAPHHRATKAWPVPVDGSLLCLPVMPPEDGTMNIVHGGTLSATEGHSRYEVAENDDPHILTIGWVYGRQIQGRVGGRWVGVESTEGLRENQNCTWTPRATVMDRERNYHDTLRPFAEALEAALAELEEALGPAEQRLMVRVDGDHVRVVWGNRRAHVNVPPEHLRWATRGDRAVSLARQVAVSGRLIEHRGAPYATGAGATAIMKDVYGFVDSRNLVDAPHADVRALRKRARGCGGDWFAILGGECALD